MHRGDNAFGPKKTPRQERAKVTVEAMLDAAARLLVEHPGEELDTNAVAARAGVSIGSLYQYFPNKGAVIQALIERHTVQKLEKFREAMESTAQLPAAARIESAIDWLLADKQTWTTLERALLEYSHRYGDPLVIGRVHARVVDALALALGEPGDPQPHLRAFVLAHAVRGALLAASLLEPQSIGDGSLRTELIRLVRGYLERQGA